MYVGLSCDSPMYCCPHISFHMQTHLRRGALPSRCATAFSLIKGLGYSLTISGTLPGGEHTSRTESSLFTQIFVSLPLRSQSRWCGRARKSAVIAIIGVAILLPPCSYLSLARFRGRGVWMPAARRFFSLHRSCCTLVCFYSIFKFLKGFFICPSTHKELGEAFCTVISQYFFHFTNCAF